MSVGMMVLAIWAAVATTLCACFLLFWALEWKEIKNREKRLDEREGALGRIAADMAGYSIGRPSVAGLPSAGTSDPTAAIYRAKQASLKGELTPENDKLSHEEPVRLSDTGYQVLRHKILPVTEAVEKDVFQRAEALNRSFALAQQGFTALDPKRRGVLEDEE